MPHKISRFKTVRAKTQKSFNRLLHIKPLNLSAILCIKSLKYFNLCDKIAFIGIAHGDTGMRAAEASRRLVLFLLLRGVLK